MTQRPNRLAGSRSPYLLQHQFNPVDWHPWGEDALRKAVREDKPLIISIGYSACHWCHVMERESFEDEELAGIMNRHFVPIKVDREERPDIDHVYMTAVQLITGQGGWPLNVFALPDGRPFHGGTYFRPVQWKALLLQIAEIYQKDKDTLINHAAQIANGVSVHSMVSIPASDEIPSQEALNGMFHSYSRSLNPEHGGSAGAPKFPLPAHLDALLRHAASSLDEQSAQHVRLTLGKMAEGGIYDHVGGGFARYSVDREWHIPHFEKMLYDNAQLISLYAEASRFFGDDFFLNVALGSVDFVERELRQTSHLFSSALDADSEGEEGRYYVWREDELREALGDDYPFFARIFGIGGHSAWEDGRQVLRLVPGHRTLWMTYDGDGRAVMLRCLQKLRQVRDKRTRPGLDDKVLTSWNAMMVKAYAGLYKATGDLSWLRKAEHLAEVLEENMADREGGIFHAWKDGQAYIPGFLEDYCHLAEAFIALHQAGLEERWLLKARDWTDQAIRRFRDPRSGLFWFSCGNDTTLISRKMEIMDTVIPSSNAVMVKVLFYLGRLLEEDSYLEAGRRALSAVASQLEKYPGAHMAWVGILAGHHAPLRTLFITGPEARAWAEGLRKVKSPFLLVALNEGNSLVTHLQARYQPSVTRAYLCTASSCLPPVDSLQDTIGLLRKEFHPE